MHTDHDHQAHRHTSQTDDGIDRRGLLKTGALSVAGAGAAAIGLNSNDARAAGDPYAPPTNPALPPSDMKLDLPRTALAHWRRYLQLEPMGSWAGLARQRLRVH